MLFRSVSQSRYPVRQLNYEDEGGYDRENELCGECLIAIKRLMYVSEHESDDEKVSKMLYYNMEE